MPAAKLKLLIEQGATFRKAFTYKVGSPPVPVDLTGMVARMQIRPTIPSRTVLASLTTENGGITLGGPAGTIDLLLTDEQTTLFTWATGVYDLELEFPNGDVKRLLYGPVTLSPEVTR